MSQVSKKIQDRLNKLRDNEEDFHLAFDEIVEEKLMELDPEWMGEMSKIYIYSGCGRYCS